MWDHCEQCRLLYGLAAQMVLGTGVLKFWSDTGLKFIVGDPIFPESTPENRSFKQLQKVLSTIQKVDQSSLDFERRMNCSRSSTCPILNIFICSGNICWWSLKLSEIIISVACFWPLKFFRGGLSIFWICIIKFCFLLTMVLNFAKISWPSSEIPWQNKKKHLQENISSLQKLLFLGRLMLSVCIAT